MSGILSTLEEFITKAKNIHGEKYGYDMVLYRGHSKKVKIICSIHGIFKQTPNNHIQGHGCMKCGKESSDSAQKHSKKQFTKRADIVHNKKYDYTNVEYVNTSTKVNIVCPKHGSFMQTPKSHLEGHGCSACSNTFYSKKAIQWLNEISEQEKIYIQHAENKGEFNIPNTKMYVDGYCEETNTVYEFYGDKWHGNLNIYNPEDHCSPCDPNITAGELYVKTVEREQRIKDYGFNLIVIWESEFFEK